MRFERKYRITGLSLEAVRLAIAQHPLGFTTLFPSRRINNIYFDTPGFAAFHANLDGNPQRTKYRIRWYGHEQAHLIDPVWECKSKQAEPGEKRSLPLPSMPWEALKSHLTQIPAFRQHNLQPVLVNTYNRDYFANLGGTFRMTVDTDLGFAPFSWQNAPHSVQYLRDNAIIIELKYDFDKDDKAKFVFDHLPFRHGKNSKYATGIQLLYPY